MSDLFAMLNLEYDGSACIIGTGPAGLMAADVLSQAGVQVRIFDHMPSPGRKLLRAGIGGLNLTHSEDAERFLSRYTPPSTLIKQALQAFNAQSVRHFAEELGIPTYIGTSGRVFPTCMKASPLLRAWLKRLQLQGVKLELNTRWLGFSGQGELLLNSTERGEMRVRADATLLALGGASWPQLGSDAAWISQLPGVPITPLRPSNVGIVIHWPASLLKHAGQPLKDCRAWRSTGGPIISGDMILTRYGLEGGLIYALGPLDSGSTFQLDLRPQLDETNLRNRLNQHRAGLSLSNRWRRAGLTPLEMDWLRESLAKPDWDQADLVAHTLKNLTLTVSGTRPLREAISTAGGICLSHLDEHFMLNTYPGVFCAGEMLDIDAPTGGYLLTAALATGYAAGQGALQWIKKGLSSSLGR